MSDESLNKLHDLNRSDPSGLPTFKYKLLLLLLNYIPLFQLILLGLWSCQKTISWPLKLGGFLFFLYLLPPIIARILLLFFKLPSIGRTPFGSKTFFLWWAIFQLQVIFCRLPFLEELLRFVPSLYSNWLRLWGSRIGKLTYWAPGTLILDRSFLEIGDEVLFGAGCRLTPHLLNRNASGEMELFLQTIKIGNHVIVGGYSLLSTGTEIAENETTKAFLISPPFSRWKNGKRVRDEHE